MDYMKNLKHLFNLFRSKPLKEITESNEHAFEDIFFGKSDVLIIENFLTNDEVKIIQNYTLHAKETFPSLVDQKYMGYTIGKTLFESDSLEMYFDLASMFQQNKLDILGINLEERITALLHAISNKPITSTIDKNTYLSISARIMHPNNKGLTLHSDFHIHQIREESRELCKNIHDKTLLSCIVIVQQPKEGGKLLIYDLNYDDIPSKLTDFSTSSYDDLIKYVKKGKHHTYNPPEGSILLFNAGQRFHEVEPIKGDTPRITVGCFASYSKNMEKILIWS